MNEDIIKRGDIYYADLGDGKGSEQKGIRPVLVIQNDRGNKFSTTIIIAAITSKGNKKEMPTHVKIDATISALPRDSVVLLEQIRTIDKRRLGGKIGKLDNKTMDLIDKGSKISIGLTDTYFDESYITERQYKINKLDMIINKYKNTKFETPMEEYERIALMGEIITYCKSFNRDPKLYLKSNDICEKIAI